MPIRETSQSATLGDLPGLRILERLILQISSGTADVGSYCVALYDVGNVTDTITYTVTVTHP